MSAPGQTSGPGASSAPRRRSRPAGGRALLFLILCFAGSAAARIGEVGGALAADPAFAIPERTALPSQDAPALAPGAPGGQPTGFSCEAPPDSLLAAIRERAAALDAREARLDAREGAVSLGESRVREEIARMEQAEKALAETLALADGAAERDVAHLVGVYEAMKPKDAAKLFDAMEPTFAAGFLSRMRPEAAGGVLAAMEANTAYAVTVVMAGRHVFEPVDPGRSSVAGPTPTPTATR